MRFRVGLIIGAAGGYVLGTKAGRERYEQLRRWGRSVAGNPKVQELAGRSKGLAGQAGRRGLHVVQQGVSKVGTGVRHRLGNGSSGDDTSQQIGI